MSLGELLIKKYPENEDSRRKIIDIGPKLKLYIIPDIEESKLGGHYHIKTHESFYVVEGDRSIP